MIKIVNLSKRQCGQLYLFLRDDDFERSNTEDAVGFPFFDTLTGDIIYLPDNLLDLEENLSEADALHLQLAVQAKMLTLPQEEAWRVKIEPIPRFVEVPTLPQALISGWLVDAGFPRGPEKWMLLDENKTKYVPGFTIDWLEKVGRERDIRYMFNIEHLVM